jgi:hypothetical protein
MLTSAAMQTQPSLTDGDRLAVQHEWQRRIEAEYRSAALTQHLTLWLLQMVAPFELVRMGLAVVEDELVHSELSRQVYVAAGGKQLGAMPPSSIGLAQPAPDRLLPAIVKTAVETFCLGETVAVRLFLRLRATCTQPDARQALDRIVKDEVRHKDFGWTMLEWLLATNEADTVRGLVERGLPTMFARLCKNYAHAQLGVHSEPNAEQAAWGLMPAPDYAAVLQETVERDYIPLFAAHGIDAERAFAAR